MRIKIMVCDKEQSKKPCTKEIKAIICRLEPSVEDLNTIVDKILSGCSFRPGITLGGHKDEDWVSQQIICIDVDNKADFVSMEDNLKVCQSLNIEPALIYKTFSFTEKNQKHRLLFVLDKEINDPKIMKKYSKTLCTLLKGDTATLSLSKIFFGTNKGHYYKNLKNITCISNIEELAKQQDETKNKEKSVPKASIHAGLQDFNKTPPQLYDSINIYSNIGGGSREKAQEGLIARLESYFSSAFFVQKHCNIVFNNHMQFNDYVKKIPLDEVLGIENKESFCCIFHDDKNPSAAIYEYNDVSYYKCYSNCLGERVLDIFNIISIALTGTMDDYKAARQYLIDKLMATIKPSKWYLDQMSIIKNNRRFLLKIDDYKDYKKMHRKMSNRNTGNVMRLLLDLAEYTLDVASEVYEGNGLIFTASQRYLARQLNVSRDTVKNRIYDFESMGFIEILSDKEAQEKYPKQFNNSLELKEKISNRDNIDKRYLKTISMYRIKNIDLNTIEKAEEILYMSFIKGATRRGESRRQSKALGTNCNKKKTKDSDKVEKDKKNLEKWFERTLNRNGCVCINDYLEYAKKKGYGKDYASSFIVEFNNKFDLERKVVTIGDITTRGIPSCKRGKHAFMKKQYL